MSDKIMAGEKLRRMAVQRTQLHIYANSRRGTELKIMIGSDGKYPTCKEYLEDEQDILNRLKAGLCHNATS